MAKPITSQLERVFGFLVANLINDNWWSASTKAGDRSYFVIGADAHQSELDGKDDFCVFEVPFRENPGPKARWWIRSQLADAGHETPLALAARNLEQCGVTAESVERFLRGMPEEKVQLSFSPHIPAQRRTTVLRNYLEARLLTSTEKSSITLDPDEMQEADLLRTKECLKLLGKKFGRILQAWAPLEPMTFDDARLKEASEAFLFGFWRACTILCVCTLESRLRALLELNDSTKLLELVAIVQEQGLFSKDDFDHARRLIQHRNRVIHDDQEVSRDDAEWDLYMCRHLIKVLTEARQL